MFGGQEAGAEDESVRSQAGRGQKTGEGSAQDHGSCGSQAGCGRESNVDVVEKLKHDKVGSRLDGRDTNTDQKATKVEKPSHDAKLSVVGNVLPITQGLAQSVSQVRRSSCSPRCLLHESCYSSLSSPGPVSLPLPPPPGVRLWPQAVKLLECRPAGCRLQV